MGTGLWNDIVELVRFLGPGGATPSMRRRLSAYVSAFHQVVVPIGESTLGRRESRKYLDVGLCEACGKLCFLLAAYAETAGLTFRPDLAVLGGAIARLYDDLVDESGDDEAGSRLAVLFRGGIFAPRSGRELLLRQLYRELERRLDRDRADPLFGAVIVLHEYQVRSRRQRGALIDSVELATITEAKGGYATLVFFALVRPMISDREMAVVRRLGAALQRIDDYLDVRMDLRTGITTEGTRRKLTVLGLHREIRCVRTLIRECYGKDQPLSGVVYLGLWLSFLRRSWPPVPPRYRPFRFLLRTVRHQ